MRELICELTGRKDQMRKKETEDLVDVIQTFVAKLRRRAKRTLETSLGTVDDSAMRATLPDQFGDSRFGFRRTQPLTRLCTRHTSLTQLLPKRCWQ